MPGLSVISLRGCAVVCTLTVLVATQYPNESSADSAGELDALVGQAIFERIWVSAPASTQSSDGLGPLFNARSCATCHGGGGRAIVGLPEDGSVTAPGLVLRLGRSDGGTDPVYGRQLQTYATQGHAAEGKVFVRREKVPVPAASGISLPVSPTRPVWSVAELAYGPLGDTTRVAGRVAPALLGSGLIEDVPEAAILAFVDPDDRDGDGVSGRANWITDASGSRSLGRYGWKASQPSLMGQIAAAFSTDLGLSSSLRTGHAGDCTEAQRLCRNGPHGAHVNAVEVEPPIPSLVKQHLQSLPPPPAADHAEGRDVFDAVGCAACHRPTLPVRAGGAIAPFTDLLLHNMGSRLADGIREGEASGEEWRTPPLWGLGQALRTETGLLHDGRARTADQAILWHGGEGEPARTRFLALQADEKMALIRFLQSL